MKPLKSNIPRSLYIRKAGLLYYFPLFPSLKPYVRKAGLPYCPPISPSLKPFVRMAGLSYYLATRLLK